MKASVIHYSPETGIVTASGSPLAGKQAVTENAAGVDVRAADVDVSLSPGLMRVESLAGPFLVTYDKDGQRVRVESAVVPTPEDEC